MKRIKEFLRERWFVLTMPFIGAGLGLCVAQLLLTVSFMWAVASFGWLAALMFSILMFRQSSVMQIEILNAKKEVVDSHNELIEQINSSIEYFNGYDEDMLESVAIYSQMAHSGVEAPVANSIIAFSQEISPEHTILLIGVDHTNSQWSIRVAGRSIYLSQLKAIWGLVNKHLEENAKPQGTLIVKKDSSIVN